MLVGSGHPARGRGSLSVHRTNSGSGGRLARLARSRGIRSLFPVTDVDSDPSSQSLHCAAPPPGPIRDRARRYGSGQIRGPKAAPETHLDHEAPARAPGQLLAARARHISMVGGRVNGRQPRCRHTRIAASTAAKPSIESEHLRAWDGQASLSGVWQRQDRQRSDRVRGGDRQEELVRRTRLLRSRDCQAPRSNRVRPQAPSRRRWRRPRAEAAARPARARLRR